MGSLRDVFAEGIAEVLAEFIEIPFFLIAFRFYIHPVNIDIFDVQDLFFFMLALDAVIPFVGISICPEGEERRPVFFVVLVMSDESRAGDFIEIVIFAARGQEAHYHDSQEESSRKRCKFFHV